jgi:hypothetical protein
MPKPFDSRFTMFVYLRGHPLLSFYFAVCDTVEAANDGYSPQAADAIDG